MAIVHSTETGRPAWRDVASRIHEAALRAVNPDDAFDVFDEDADLAGAVRQHAPVKQVWGTYLHEEDGVYCQSCYYPASAEELLRASTAEPGFRGYRCGEPCL